VTLFRSIAIPILVFLIDRISKVLVLWRLNWPGQSIDLYGPLSIYYIKNSGGAFGFFQNKGSLFSLLSAVLTTLVILSLVFMNFKSPLAKIGLLIMLGGALGNLADRLLLGGVVDFIKFGRFPIFNLADVAIVSGAGCVIFALLTSSSTSI